MAIMGIRQRERGNVVLVTFYRGIVDAHIHQASRSLESRPGKMRTIAKERGDPFLLNGRRPARSKHAVQGEANQQVAK